MAEVTFVDSDGNNKIDTAIVFEKIGGEVTNVASDKITFAGKSYKFADEIIDEELEADDYAVMSYSMYEDCKEIVKADVVTDELEGSKNKTSDNGNYSQYEIAGTWYNIDTTDSDTGYDNVSVGDTVLAYVANGVILNIDTDDGTGAIPTNIAVVVGNGSGSTTLYGDQVKLRYFDGTLKTVTIDSDNSIAGSDTQLGRAYRVSGSDSSTKLEELKNQKYNGYLTLIHGNYSSGDEEDVVLSSSNTIAGKRVADDAVIVVWDEKGSSKTITGKQFNNLSASAPLETTDGAGAVFTKDYNGLDRVRLASVEVTSGSTIGDISGTSNDYYGYITADAVERSNGDITYTLWNGSDNLPVTEENGDASARAKGTVIGYGSIDADGYIQDVDDTYGRIQDESTENSTSAGEFSVGANLASTTRSISVGDNQLNVTADTKVLVIDSSEDDDAIGQEYIYGTTTLRKADKDVNDDYMNNVAYILDEDVVDGEADLELLIIDNTGKFDWIDDGSSDDEEEEEEGGSSTKDNITVTTDASLAVDKVLTSIDGSGNLTIALPAPTGAASVTADITVKVDGINATAAEGSITGDQKTWTVTGKNLSDKNEITIDVKNYKVVKTVAKGALTFNGLPEEPSTGTAKADLPTTAPTTSVEGLGTVSAVTWTEGGSGSASGEVDAGDTWTAEFTVKAADGYQFDTTASAYTVGRANTVSANADTLTVTFEFTIS